MSGNIPKKNAYGVFTGELVRYARGCNHLYDFSERLNILVKKKTLLSQNFRSSRSNIFFKLKKSALMQYKIYKIYKITQLTQNNKYHHKATNTATYATNTATNTSEQQQKKNKQKK